VKLIYRGAEADLMLDEWAGTPAVYKFRKRLPYRLLELDRAIRAHRTIHEAQMVHQARRGGVRTPYIYYVGPSESLLVMEYITGDRLKQLLSEDEGGDYDDDHHHHPAEMMFSFGRVAGLLHTAGIMHGDLTTSNVIVNKNGELTVIDFGLSLHSQKVEDHAVDLRLIKETLNGAHSRISTRAFSSFLEGYGGEVGDSRLATVRRKLVEIERRGRYARVE
jgi:TP53 regulating kinase-like protein